MQKSKVLRTALCFLFPVVFNILFFMLAGTDHPISVWIAYAFIHLSWVLLIVTPLLTPTGISRGLFNLSMYSVSLMYFLAELVVGTVIIASQTEAIKLPIVIQMLLLAFYAVVLISAMLANEHSAEYTEQLQHGSGDISDLCSRVKSLFDIIPDERLSRELQRTYNTIHAAPIAKAQHLISISVELRQLESAIEHNNLEEAISMCKKIQRIVG